MAAASSSAARGGGAVAILSSPPQACTKTCRTLSKVTARLCSRPAWTPSASASASRRDADFDSFAPDSVVARVTFSSDAFVSAAKRASKTSASASRSSAANATQNAT